MSTALPAIEDGLRASTPVLWAKVEKTRREKTQNTTKHKQHPQSSSSKKQRWFPSKLCCFDTVVALFFSAFSASQVYCLGHLTSLCNQETQSGAVWSYARLYWSSHLQHNGKGRSPLKNIRRTSPGAKLNGSEQHSQAVTKWEIRAWVWILVVAQVDVVLDALQTDSKTLLHLMLLAFLIICTGHRTYSDIQWHTRHAPNSHWPSCNLRISWDTFTPLNSKMTLPNATANAETDGHVFHRLKFSPPPPPPQQQQQQQQQQRMKGNNPRRANGLPGLQFLLCFIAALPRKVFSDEV